MALSLNLGTSIVGSSWPAWNEKQLFRSELVSALVSNGTLTFEVHGGHGDVTAVFARTDASVVVQGGAQFTVQVAAHNVSISLPSVARWTISIS